MTTIESVNLNAALAGDQHAFGQVVEPYRKELTAHCYRLTSSMQDAEDMVQETLLRAWRKRSSYAGRATFRAWLYKIATISHFLQAGLFEKFDLPETTSPQG